MFAVDDVLVTDELLDAHFSCALGACLGGCCVQGDSGAPITTEERSELESILPSVRPYLRQEALDVIEKYGVWEEVEENKFATTCVDNAECVFVTYEGPVAKCAIEKAFFEGRISFRKPISCHLFPIIVEQFGDVEALNYEQIPLCIPAVNHGCKKNIQLIDFLREPLERKFGKAWYLKFKQAYEEHRQKSVSDRNVGIEEKTGSRC